MDRRRRRTRPKVAPKTLIAIESVSFAVFAGIAVFIVVVMVSTIADPLFSWNDNASRARAPIPAWLGFAAAVLGALVTGQLAIRSARGLVEAVRRLRRERPYADPLRLAHPRGRRARGLAPPEE